MRTLPATLLMLPLVVASACQPGGEPGPGSPLTPSSGSASGYYHVTLDTSALGRGADEVLTTDMLGGLIGLDGLHYTATGYALVATMFALSINEQIGGDVLLPDAEAVLAADPNSPAALAAAGLDPAACADE